jgi:hypothetical protein
MPKNFVSFKSALSLVCFTLNFLGSVAHAEIFHYDLKGVHDLIAPEFGYLSPVAGFMLLGTKNIENRRFYGNYGPEVADQRTPKGKLIHKGFGCLSGKIGEILKANHDCPQDSVSELIQRLFPSQDGVNFVANQIPTDSVSHLDPKTIGQVLGRLSRVTEGDLLQFDREAQLESDLTQILTQGFYRAQKTKIELQIQSCSPDQKDVREDLQAKLAGLEEILSEFGLPTQETSDSDSGSELNSQRNSPTTLPKKGEAPKKKDKNFKNLAQLIIAALRETQAALKKTHAQPYPAHLVEQVLLSFFLKKGNHKADFIPLLQGMHQQNPHLILHPEVLDPHSPVHQQFVASQYQASDFDPTPLNDHPDTAAKDLLSHPEKLAFFATQDQLSKQPFPPIISYASAKHSSLNDANYPDCGETSLRNFLNIALFNPDTRRFDHKYLKSLKKKNPALSFSPALQAFYENHPDPGLSASQEARNAWSETVVSNHAGVDYLKPKEAPQCEINAGIDNAMAVFDRLFYAGQKAQATPSPFNRTLPRKDRLNHLCETLSRPGFKLSWKDKIPKPNGELSDTGTELELSINGNPAFIWQFGGGHFSLQPIHNGLNSWKDRVGVEMAKQIAVSQSHSPQALNQASPLNWVLSERNWDEVMTHLPEPQKFEAEHTSHFYSLPLNSTDTKLFAFSMAVASPLAQPLKFFAQRLRSKVPQNDLRTQQEIHSALAEAGYPYMEEDMRVEGNPDSLHALGKPDAIYTPVSRERLALKFGEAAASAMGRTWARQMQGHSIAIGEPLMDSDGEEPMLRFEDSKKACLDLNLPEKREAVQEAFLAREAALDQVRRDQTIKDPAERIQKLSQIHKTMLIPGIFLMSQEEWSVLEEDLGYQDQRYIPQILPKLVNRQFWSSSGVPTRAYGAFIFDGDHGKILSTDYRYYDKQVRCGAAAW